MKNKEKISLFWFKRSVYHCFCIALIIFFAGGLLFAESGRTILEILRNLEQRGYTMIYVWIYFLLALILYRSRNKIMGEKESYSFPVCNGINTSYVTAKSKNLYSDI